MKVRESFKYFRNLWRLVSALRLAFFPVISDESVSEPQEAEPRGLCMRA